MEDLSQNSHEFQKNKQISTYGEYNLITAPNISDFNKYYSLKICKENMSESCKMLYISPVQQSLSLEGLPEGSYMADVSLCDYKNPENCLDLGTLGPIAQRPLANEVAQRLLNENFENNNKAFQTGVKFYRSVDKLEQGLQSCKVADQLKNQLNTVINILKANMFLQEKDTGWEWVRFVHDYDLTSVSLQLMSILSQDIVKLELGPSTMSRLLGFWENATALFRYKVPDPKADIPISSHRYVMPIKYGETLATWTGGHVTHIAPLIGRKDDLFINKVLNAKRSVEEFQAEIVKEIPKAIRKRYKKVPEEDLKIIEGTKVDASDNNIEISITERVKTKDAIRKVILKHHRELNNPVDIRKIDYFLDYSIAEISKRASGKFILDEPIREFLEGKQKAFYAGWASGPDGKARIYDWWIDTQLVYSHEIINNKLVPTSTAKDALPGVPQKEPITKITTEDFERFRQWFTSLANYSEKDQLEQAIFALQKRIDDFDKDIVEYPKRKKEAEDFKKTYGISLKTNLEGKLKELKAIREKVAKMENDRRAKFAKENNGKYPTPEEYKFLYNNCSTFTGTCLKQATDPESERFTQLGPIDTPKNADILGQYYKQVQSFQGALRYYFRGLYNNTQVFGLGLVEDQSNTLPIKYYAMKQYQNVLSLLTIEREFWEQQKSAGEEVQCVLDKFASFADEFQPIVLEFDRILQTRLDIRNELLLLDAS